MVTTMGLLDSASVAFPEDPVCVALNIVARLGLLKAVFPPGGVEKALLNPDEVAIKLLGGNQAGAGAGEGVENQVAGVGAGQDDLG